MTTIITIHGTFAAHEGDIANDSIPKEDRWWQKKSSFQKGVENKLVLEGHSNKIEWRPFHWSGLNSEQSRRRSGEELFNFLKNEYEKTNEPYHLIGHSHGGAVIIEALRQSTKHNYRLKKLQSWTTVATPFLEFKPKRNLLKRLTRVFQILLVFIALYCFTAYSGSKIFLCSAASTFSSSFGISQCAIESESSNPKDLIDLETIKRVEFYTSDNKLENYLTISQTLEKSDQQIRRIKPLKWIDKSNGKETEFRFGIDIPVGSSSSPSDLDISSFVRFLDDENREFDWCSPLNWDFYDIQKPLSERIKPIEELCAQYTNWSPDDVSSQEYRELTAQIGSRYSQRYSQATIPKLNFRITNQNDKVQFFTVEYLGERPLFLPKINYRTFTPWTDILFSLKFLLILFSLLSPIFVVAYLVWRSQKYIIEYHRSLKSSKLNEWYYEYWVQLFHPKDEAINSIASSTQVSLKIIPKDLLRGWFMTGLSLSILTFILFFIPDETIPPNKQHIQRPPQDYAFVDSFKQTMSLLYHTESGQGVSSYIDTALQFFTSLLVLILGVGVVSAIGRLLEVKLLNPLIKGKLDKVFESAVSTQAFGADIVGEKVVKCQPKPQEFVEHTNTELPALVASKIEEQTELYSHKLVPFFREKFLKGRISKERLTLIEWLESEDNSGDVSDFLIHNAYFRTPEFQNLVGDFLIKKAEFMASRDID